MILSRTTIKFLPAAMVLPAWLSIALREDLLAPSFKTYYPLTIAMIFGSMIAGSTPIGGGVVAFPVSVLFIGFTASQGRDFSLMIQSVGMSAASFLILTQKTHLVVGCGELVATFALFSVFGLIVGFQMTIASFVIMCMYTTTTAAFALILAYVDTCLHISKNQDEEYEMEFTFRTDSIPTTDIEELRNDTIVMEEKQTSTSKFSSIVDLVLLLIFSLCGGIISSQIGTGADIAWYAYGSLFHNSRKYNKRMTGNELTATSIVIMTINSIFGTVMRVSTSGTNAPTSEVYEALIACACIVVIGAPLGSMFLSAEHQKKLKILFYVLAFVQIVTFGILKVKRNVLAWSLIGGLLAFVSLGILVLDCVVFKTGLGGTFFCRQNEKGRR